MLVGVRHGAAIGRVHPLAPAIAIVSGAAMWLAGSHAVGIGVSVGAVLAYVNTLLLSGRVEVAANSGDIARALLIMQIGLLFTFTIVAITTVVLIHFSLQMAVASGIAFAVVQLAMLATFYWTRGRMDVAAGRQAS